MKMKDDELEHLTKWNFESENPTIWKRFGSFTGYVFPTYNAMEEQTYDRFWLFLNPNKLYPANFWHSISDEGGGQHDKFWKILSDYFQ